MTEQPLFYLQRRFSPTIGVETDFAFKAQLSEGQDTVSSEVQAAEEAGDTSACIAAEKVTVTSATKKALGSEAARKSAKRSRFVDILQKINPMDKRVVRPRKYTAAEILLCTLFSVAAGGVSWYETEELSEELPDTGRKYLPFKKVLSSHDTLNRFFQLIEPSATEEVFNTFLTRLTDGSVKGHMINTDGKQINGAAKAGGEVVHILTARSSDLKLSFGQHRVDRKCNEIKAISITVECFGSQKGRSHYY